MKRTLFAVAVIGFVMTSCKKDYTCECKTSSTFSGFASATATSQTGKMKKADAEAACNKGDSEYSSVDPFTGDTYTIKSECGIKE